MRITLDEILSDFHGQSVSGGGGVGSDTQLLREQAALACPRSYSAASVTNSPAAIFSFITGALLALLALAVCAAEFYGTVEVACGKTNVVWRNVPAHVFVQGTLDATNWFDLTEHRTIDGSPLGSFSFRIPTQDTNAFYRLRTP